MADDKPFRAVNTTVEYSTSPVTTVDTDTTFAEQVSATLSGVTANMKNVTVSEPEGPVEKIDLLGKDSNDFQNALMEEKPYGLATVSGTMVLDDDEQLEGMIDDPVAITSGYTRRQLGRGNRAVGAIVVRISGVSADRIYGYNNVYVSRIGDTRIDGADGHWEIDFEASCLPKDFYIEVKD